MEADGLSPMDKDEFILMARTFDSPATYGLKSNSPADTRPTYSSNAPDEWTDETLEDIYKSHMLGSMTVENPGGPDLGLGPGIGVESMSYEDFVAYIQKHFPTPHDYGYFILDSGEGTRSVIRGWDSGPHGLLGNPTWYAKRYYGYN